MRRIAFFAVPMFLAQVLGAQVITTIAGTSWSFPSNSQSALSAPLGEVSGAAFDSQGNLYLADPTNALILKISSSGTLSIAAGNGLSGHSGDGGPAINASINPTDVAVDSNNNLYIQDQSYIRMVTPSGTISTIAGNGAFGFSGDGGNPTNASLNAVTGMAFDSHGNLYFADTYNNRVRMIGNGTITTIAGTGAGNFGGDGGPAASALLNLPSGLAFDSFGNLYIGDSGNQRVRVVTLSPSTTTGPISTLVGGNKQFAAPANLAVDTKGNLYICDTGLNTVFAYSFNTKVVTNFAGASVASGAYAGDGGSAAQARLYSPDGLAVDSQGNVYIADSGNYRLREVSSGSLKISTVAGNGTYRFAGDGGQAINAQLNFPTGMALDSGGNLYFADSDNNRIRKVTPAGIISTVAGNGLAGYSGDSQTPARLDGVA